MIESWIASSSAEGKAPAAGALQPGESQAQFIAMHQKTEKALKMLNELKKDTAAKK